MHNFFTNAKNVFKACLNESNESINTYKSEGKDPQKLEILFLHFDFFSFPLVTDYCIVMTKWTTALFENFDMWVAGWHVP